MQMDFLCNCMQSFVNDTIERERCIHLTSSVLSLDSRMGYCAVGYRDDEGRSVYDSGGRNRSVEKGKYELRSYTGKEGQVMMSETFT
jgi:hypothetical protein